MNDCTAGVCTPAPAERIASTTKNSASPAVPRAIETDSATVTAAMSASGRTMSAFLFQRSAHAPPNSESTACGTHAQSIATVIVTPESVCMTRYQKTAYCTMLDPTSESACPVSNSATRMCQDCKWGWCVMMAHFLSEAAVCAHAGDVRDYGRCIRKRCDGMPRQTSADRLRRKWFVDLFVRITGSWKAEDAHQRAQGISAATFAIMALPHMEHQCSSFCGTCQNRAPLYFLYLL